MRLGGKHQSLTQLHSRSYPKITFTPSAPALIAFLSSSLRDPLLALCPGMENFDLEPGLVEAMEGGKPNFRAGKMEIINNYKECCYHLPSRISVIRFQEAAQKVEPNHLNWDPTKPKENTKKPFETLELLDAYWSKCEASPEPLPTGYLYIVEDPCHQIFEAFQVKFGLHDAFLARHLFTSVLPKDELEQDWQKRISLRMLATTYNRNDRSGISLRYYDLLRAAEGCFHLGAKEVLLTASNVKRRVAKYSPTEGWWATLQILPLMRNISLQVLPAKRGGSWNGTWLYAVNSLPLKVLNSQLTLR